MNFNNYIDKFNNYFRNSYGFDKLSKYLLIGGFLFVLLNIAPLFGTVLIGYSTFRTISKNKYKRHQELASFENYMSILTQRFGKYRYKLEQFKHYKILKCPNCSQKLRVPRKQGKITITCRACRTEFKSKS